jgi:serine/threonine protein kinase
MVPLINGGDLDRSLNMFGPMNEHTVRYYAASIITALEGMHARGYVYKDIKLKNLLLDELGRLQITDFGLTRFAAKNPSNPSIPTNCVTNGVTGRAGTKSYKSPEVLTGSGHSYPSDFYALGVVLYKMLTGHKLYHSEHDLPKLSHFLRIPKYHHYVLKQPRWRAFGVYDLYTKVQQDFAANGFSESTYDVLDYSVQRDYLAFHLSAVLNSKFSEQGGQIAKDWKRSGGSNQTQDGETDEENGQNNDNGDNGDKKKFKKIQKKSPNSLLYPYKPEELFVDGVGPIFSPDESIKHQEDIANGKLSNSKGKVNGKLAWLSLSDDAVDFLTQMTELNPFYRLGTPNRYYRDYNPDIYHGEEDKQTVSVEQPQTGSIVELNTHKEHWLDSFSQDFSHTQAALLSSQRFDYLSDVVGIANMEEIEWREENGEFLESIIKKNNGGDKSSIKNNTKNDGEYDTKNYDGKNQPKATPHKHCFVQFIDVNKELPSFRGKDKDGKWKGLHNGFVELKNHPWFKNFDWDLMTESSIVFNTNNQQNGQSGQNDQNGRNLKNDTFIPGHEKIQFASVDVKNYQQRFPEMIDAKDDHFDQKWQSLFEGLDFNTTI